MNRTHRDPICTRPPGLRFPERIDPSGEEGPTRVQARSTRWERVARGWYVPVDRPAVVEQRILDAACRLRVGEAVTAWASLRWRGGAFFDGRGPGGEGCLPVPLLIHDSLAARPGTTLSKAQLAPSEMKYVAGLPVTSVQRGLFDEVVRRGQLWAGVEAVAMAAAARLISTALFSRYVARRRAWTGVPLVREVLGYARDDLRSPAEVRLHLVWELVAELERALANKPVFGLDGTLLGVPDLFDPVAGVVGEYDGEHHRSAGQHRSDVERETRFRDHGLEYFTVVRGDSRSAAAGRMVRTRARARFLPPELCAWTLTPPHWYDVPEPLHDYLVRTGQADELTHT